MTRLLAVLLGAAALSPSAAAWGQSAPPTPDRVTALVRKLESSDTYLQVRVLWRRSPGEAGPEAIVMGDWGGSAGLDDLYALYGRCGLRTLTVAAGDTLAVHVSGGRVAFEAPLVVEFFNGAPTAGDAAVPLPIVWQADDFQLDLPALLHRQFGDQDLRFRRIAISSELSRWANELDRPDTVYPAPPNAFGGTPVTVQGLMDLMLTGHVRQARRILDESWPAIASRSDVRAHGEQAFWSDLARALTQNPLWNRFDLRRLPDAGLIDAAARTGRALPAPTPDRPLTHITPRSLSASCRS